MAASSARARLRSIKGWVTMKISTSTRPEANPATASALNLIGSDTNPMFSVPFHWHVVLGGWAFGAVFMATDPVTTPTTPIGAWLFGAGVGGLVVLIRLWGGLPEGVMYAVLLMNALAPHIETYTQPKPFGGRLGNER